MDIIGWIWWALGGLLGLLWSLFWLLIGGWVSALFQVAVVVAAIFYFKYGWQRAPVELAKQANVVGRFVWRWVRSGDGLGEPRIETREVIRTVRARELGDVNFSTMLSILLLAGFAIVSLTFG